MRFGWARAAVAEALDVVFAAGASVCAVGVATIALYFGVLGYSEWTATGVPTETHTVRLRNHATTYYITPGQRTVRSWATLAIGVFAIMAGGSVAGGADWLRRRVVGCS